MKSNTKSSVTLPAAELRLVEELQRRLPARTKVEVVRRGLRLLKESVDREALRAAYARASRAARESTLKEIEDLSDLAAEGLPD